MRLDPNAGHGTDREPEDGRPGLDPTASSRAQGRPGAHPTLERLIEGHREPALRRASLLAMRVRRDAETLERIGALVGSRRAEWLRFARDNRIAGHVAATILEVWGQDVAEGPECRRIVDEEGSRIRGLLDELDRIGEALARESIDVVALKNAGIARALYPFPERCPMGDLDLLVRRDRLRDAHRVMLELGFAHATRAPVLEPADLEHALWSGGAEYVLRRGEHEVWVELQWRPIAGRWIAREAEPPGEELIARSVPIAASRVRLLAPTDNMLQVALHTAKHSYCRAPGLRLHTDVERLAALAPPDWGALVARARAMGLATAVYFSLALARALLDAAVPVVALDALAPDALRRRLVCGALRRADVFFPDERKFNRATMAIFHALLYDRADRLLQAVGGSTEA
ncbi:MAG: nucleotidyltransferase family protein, partial [Myxococcota bacterium]|nr:nucleotidyltransferase family protein [Myxococcota bacterium]